MMITFVLYGRYHTPTKFTIAEQNHCAVMILNRYL